MKCQSQFTPAVAEPVITEDEVERLYDAALAGIEEDIGRELTASERAELDRPSALGVDAAEAIGWAFSNGGRDAVEALLGGDLPAQRLRGAPASACRAHAHGRRIAHVISRARLRGPVTRAPRRSRSPSGRPRAQATRSSAKSGDSPEDAGDLDDPAPGWHWAQPAWGCSA